MANALSAGIGIPLSLAALALVALSPVARQNGWHLGSVIVFGLALLVLYLSSTLNHSLPPGEGKEFFHNFDQVAIYLLIAGTYTPVALVSLHGVAGYTFFAAQWGLAFVGIAHKLLVRNEFERGVGTVTIITYVIMGWMALLVGPALLASLQVAGLAWMVLGGFFYTFGLVFFALKRMPYHHLVWHVFVLLGSACHVAMVWKHVRWG